MTDNFRNKKVAKFVCGLAVSTIADFFIFYGFSGRQNSNEIEYRISRNPEIFSQPVKLDFGELPLNFEADAGQIDEQVKFVSRGQGFGLFHGNSFRSDRRFACTGGFRRRRKG